MLCRGGRRPSAPSNPECYILSCVERWNVFPTFLVSEAHTSQPSLRNISHARHRMVWLILDFPYFLIIISRYVELDPGHSRSFLLSQLTSPRCRASTIIEKLLCIYIYLLVYLFIYWFAFWKGSLQFRHLSNISLCRWREVYAQGHFKNKWGM